MNQVGFEATTPVLELSTTAFGCSSPSAYYPQNYIICRVKTFFLLNREMHRVALRPGVDASRALVV
jgi:hypothetical protein